MPTRRLDVFFYGLFMDAELLRRKGVQPENPRPAAVLGHALRIGNRAALVPDPTRRAHGVVMALSHAEIEQLYSEESVRVYKPEPVLCELSDGSHVPALSFNLVEPPSPNDRNPDYAVKLRDLAESLYLPVNYIAEISEFAQR